MNTAALAFVTLTLTASQSLAASRASGDAAADQLTSRAATIPVDFPTFTIPASQPRADALRDLFWQHDQNLSPMATLWDEWLLTPTMWPLHTHARAAAQWRKTLLSRDIDPDGYVATHQHQSIAHQRGWPFPAWHQSPNNFGWHFSFDKTIGTPWRPDNITNPADWTTTGTTSQGIKKTGWTLTLTTATAAIAPPPINNSAHAAPFLQLRWQADNFNPAAQPYIEWTTTATAALSRQNRMYFDPPVPGKMQYTMIPLYRHPGWRGQQITGLRLNFDNDTTGAKVIIQALFAQFDTRHDVNNPAYVSACVDYFHWTGDLSFLRENIERMRLAMRFMETEFDTEKDGIVKVPWVGHEGTSGLVADPDGKNQMRGGYGVGNNYWDLLPFGQQDSYATIRHFGAANKMATLEGEIAAHPQWNIQTSPLARSADHWRAQAALARENGNRLFWNAATGRFTLGIDSEGQQADFGFTFLNLEAIAYDFATPEHAKLIMEWMDGHRAIATDTAQTTDIYHWRFAPRATTRRNLHHYGWFWSGADSIPFGDQVQDGGAVLGFSYHDIMARLKVLGPDDAARRLGEIADWYREVVNAGGYRAYYDGKSHPGTLQGGNVPGGLGLDREFFESVMVPQVMIDGFLGLKPTADGLSLNPQLPAEWPRLTINNITLHGYVVTVDATSATLTINSQRTPSAGDALTLELPSGWKPAAGDTALRQIPATPGGQPRYRWDATQPANFITKSN